MRKKLTYRIFFLLSIIIIIFSFLFFQEKINHLISQKQIAKPFIKLNKDKLIRIIFEDENKKIEVYKKNNHWYLKKDNFEFKADEERINKTIDALINIKKEEVISQNKNKHQSFGIDKKKITFYAGKNKLEIYIGNSINFSNNYVRIDNENTVFLAENLNDVFSNNDWRDLRVGLINKQEEVNSLEINYFNKGKSLKLLKEKGDWKINEKNTKKERVDFFINDLITLKADDIITQENFTLLNPEITINVKENNQLKKTSIFSIDTNYYLLKIEGNKLIYKIKKIYISSLEKDEDDFIQ